MAGTFAPDLSLHTDQGMTSVAELMHAARPVLLDLADRPDLRQAARDWQPRVDIHTAKTADRPADALLIRPDAHIAWAVTIDEPTDSAAPALRERSPAGSARPETTIRSLHRPRRFRALGESSRPPAGSAALSPESLGFDCVGDRVVLCGGRQQAYS